MGLCSAFVNLTRLWIIKKLNEKKNDDEPSAMCQFDTALLSRTL
jgi:hypothetical protein